MRRNRLTLALILGSCLAPHGAGAAPAQEPVEIELYAAASLRDALRELAPALERATGTNVALNLGASSDLARQIVAANRADVYFSADEAWMDHVAEAGLVDAGSRRSPLSNRLVVVVPADSTLEVGSAADLASPAVRRLSLAQPETVPAGKYAKAWLESRGQWEAVAERVVPALDVRAALAAAETGAVEAGVVYSTDVAGRALARGPWGHVDRVRVAYEVPENEGPRISYALAALAERPHLDVARAVVAWLAGPRAAPVFERFGFVTRAASP